MQMNSLPSLFSTQPMPLPATPSAPSSSKPSSAQSVSTPSPGGPDAHAGQADKHPFAAMLKKQQVIERAPGTSPPAALSKVDAPTTEAAAPAEDPSALAGTTKLATTSRSRRVDAGASSKADAPADPKAAAVAPSAAKDEKDAKETKDATADPKSLTAAVLQPTQQTLPGTVECPVDLGLSAVAQRTGGAADRGKPAIAVDADDTNARGAAWGADARTSTNPADTAAATRIDKVDAASAAMRIATRADVAGDKLEAVKHVALDDRTGRVDAPTAGPTFANTLAQLGGASAAPSAPVDVTVATPVNTPEFAQALGTQISILVADGVQRAELHLNPADMGPVSIEITLNGTQAQVDFGADLASTRHAIEAGLPELASALQDAGFTLHGGGVSQHSAKQSEAGQSRDDGSAAEGSRGSSAIGSSPSTASTAAARHRVAMTGGVDVYA